MSANGGDKDANGPAVIDVEPVSGEASGGDGNGRGPKRRWPIVARSWNRVADRLPSVRQLRRKFSDGFTARLLVAFSSLSVRSKIAGALIVVLALAIASLGAVTFSRQKRILQQEMRKRAEVLVNQLANVGKEGLLTKQELGAFGTIKDLQSNSGLVYAMVLDADNRVFVDNLLTAKGTARADPVDAAARKADGLLFQETTFGGEPVLDTALPITLKAKNFRLGTARIGLSAKELTAAIRRQQVVFFWISLVFVVIGLLISYGLARVLTRPIYTLAVGMQIVADGDLSQQVKVFYHDEIGKLTESFNQMILSLREKLHMEKYLSGSALKSIRRDRDMTSLKLGGDKKYVTALFSDVRGFTAMSEKMSPEDVVAVLNIYLNLQSKVVLQRGGAVDKFVGDEVMAIFEGKGQEVNAVRAALEIQRYCQAMNWARAKAGKKQMLLGVGLNSGDVIMGNMGSEEQMNYTVIGDNINIAARLCGTAHAGQVVVSKAVADALGKDAKLKKLEPVMVKGKDKPQEIYEVLDVNGASRRYMRRAIDVAAAYRLVGLSDEETPAVAKNVGPGGCLLEVASPLGVGTKLIVELKDLPLAAPLKAAVKHVRKQDQRYYAGVIFEEQPEETKHQISDWVHRIESEIARGGRA